MVTHFLGHEEVRAFLRDLAGSILGFGLKTWCPIGPSGNVLAETLLELEPSLKAGLAVVPVGYDRESKKISLKSSNPELDFRGADVLVLDSSVHSGTTMQSVAKKIAEFGPQSVATYSLVLKRGASFVPSFWGVMIGDHDRAYFLLDKLPNNHLRSKPPACGLRKLTEVDLGSAPVVSGVASLDRITWGDRYYDMRLSENGRCTYLLETSHGVGGYLTISLRGAQKPAALLLVIDEVVVAKSEQGKDYGSSLMRFAETLARHNCCSALTLWAIEDKVSFYEGASYSRVHGEEMDLEGERYFLMNKKIIYHI